MCWMLGALTTTHHEYKCGIPSMERHADILLLSDAKRLQICKKNVIYLQEDKILLFD